MSHQQSPILTRERDRKYNAVFRAIARSDEPPTRQELTDETNLSDSQIARVLRALDDHGRVRQVTDDADGRIVRYEISPGIDK
ncbi:hypothetical protein CP556_24965 [Natrinema sp. CBA1119]|uniref:helix-turn-helix domain-containing protein n=1 Tax=Natrinema sp. CBA1119 TaxID=1608465 RepID=UPI000BF63475|nr:MarR family transcriptional regulator [Natrinema sp. CBA1119]PGF14258.1 hypothetical protein CP556_24965 [Natrinema sp. CBA1119]